VNLRIKNIYAKLKQEAIDGLIVSSAANISYLTKFESRDSCLLVSKKGNVYFTDSRYIAETKEIIKGTAALKEIKDSVFNLISETCLNLGLKRVGFEEKHLSFAQYKKISKTLSKKTNLIPTYNLIEKLRQIKEPEELEKIKKAVRITLEAFKFIEGFNSAGRTEIEIVGELERFIRYHGAGNSAFQIIVASGPNSSYPHHIPTHKRIKQDEPLLIDIGVDYLGYKSDLTRVFFLGKISLCIKRTYDIVLQAQKRAISKIKPAVRISEIDRASRQYIADKGYGRFFGHSLGHGVGLEVHEQPRISAKENGLLVPGMVFTLEPAIYLPRRFGIRIEDMVLVTKKGCEELSGTINK